MFEFERTTVTVKVPFHKKISFGGTQTTAGALDFFKKLHSEDDLHMDEIKEVTRLLDEAKSCGSERTSFWIQNNEMHLTIEFNKVSDISLFIDLIS